MRRRMTRRLSSISCMSCTRASPRRVIVCSHGAASGCVLCATKYFTTEEKVVNRLESLGPAPLLLAALVVAELLLWDVRLGASAALAGVLAVVVACAARPACAAGAGGRV